ncbi:MAG: DUF2142 domain-containing protein [Pseudomonadota bacterium]
MTRLPVISLADAYALIALLFGAFFLVATPPFGVGDETAHFERSYEIATGRYLGAEGLPAGMQTLIDDAFGRVKSGDRVTADDYERWSRIDLAAKQVTPWPEPIRAVLRLHSPVCYIHLAPVVALGVALNLPPLAIFYLGRLVALVIGVFLVRAAIARAPSSLRPAMLLVGLLPTAVVFFAGYNIESFLVGLGFYYFALVAGFASEPEKRLVPREIALLAATGFLFGQFKTGYMLAPAIALILPRSKFASRRDQIAVLALCIAPGILASLAWAGVVKSSILGGLVYTTMDGNHVEPAAQLAGIIADPLGYASVLWRTFTASDAPDFAWQSFLGLGGWTNIPLPPLVYAFLTLSLALVWLSGDKPPPPLTNPFASAVQSGVFAATALAILTLVYLQWDGVGDKVISGFQGRYLLAIAPFVAALAPVRLSFLAAQGRRAGLAVAAPMLGLVAMAAAVLAQYYG